MESSADALTISVHVKVARLVSAGPVPAATTELTGSSDPLRLRVHAELDAGASALRLHCEVHNRLTTEARGVGLRSAVAALTRGCPGLMNDGEFACLFGPCMQQVSACIS